MVTLDEVREARDRIRGEVVRTPLVSPEALEKRLGMPVALKLENFQRTGAFKFRGALNCVLRLVATRGAPGLHLVTASSGNHALGMSLAGRLAGVPVTVVMPEGAPLVKQEKARAYGARVILHGEAYDDAQVCARRLADQAGAVYIPSFNHPDIMAGQGTVALEILEDLPAPGTMVFPIGGGGLAAGMAVVLRVLSPRTVLVGVQAEGAASTKVSLERGEPVELESVHTVADGIAVRRPGDLTFAVVRELVDRVVTVSDEEILAAMRLLVTEASLVPEPAGVAAVAALLAGRIGPASRADRAGRAGRRAADAPERAAAAPEAPGGPVVAVVTGGNVDVGLLRRVLQPV
ncbi:MAG: threonine/serine dehydratase [Bacillota bacterium]|nr:threonine/serine dehydratase [Bacillota bacterium]